MSVGELEVMVGRDRVAVPDPFNPWRGIVGESYARRVDHAATIRGETIVGYDDALLTELESELRRPLDAVDSALAAEDLALGRKQAAMEATYESELEELAVLEGWANLNPASPELEGAVEAQREIVVEAADRMTEIYDTVEASPGRLRRPDRYLGSFDWAAAVEWVAVKREQAIREALLDLAAAEATSAWNVSLEVPELMSGVKQIGTGRLTAVLAAEDPAGAPIVERMDVSAPRAIEGLRDVIDDRRAERFEVYIGPLAESLPDAPDAWIRSRRAELGSPRDCIKRGAARETLRLEAIQGAVLESRDQAVADAIAFEATDPECAAIARRLAGTAQAELDELDEELFRLQQAGTHLDAQLVRDDHRFMRAVAYEDEFQIRRHVEIAEEVERSVVNPPAHVTRLIGVTPAVDGPERDEWTAITREVELNRVSRESARRERLEPPARDLAAERRLGERIDRFRELRGMEPRAQASLVLPRDPPGHEMG